MLTPGVSPIEHQHGRTLVDYGDQHIDEVGIGPARHVGLLAVDYQHVAVADRLGRVRRVIRLGESERRAFLAAQQRLEVAAAQRFFDPREHPGPRSEHRARDRRIVSSERIPGDRQGELAGFGPRRMPQVESW